MMKSIVDLSTTDVIQISLDQNTTYTFAVEPNSWDESRLVPKFTLNGEDICCVGTDEELTTEFCEAVCVLLATVKLKVITGD